MNALRSRLNLESLGERIVPSTTDTVPGSPAYQVAPPDTTNPPPDAVTLENHDDGSGVPGGTTLENRNSGTVPVSVTAAYTAAERKLDEREQKEYDSLKKQKGEVEARIKALETAQIKMEAEREVLKKQLTRDKALLEAAKKDYEAAKKEFDDFEKKTPDWLSGPPSDVREGSRLKTARDTALGTWQGINKVVESTERIIANLEVKIKAINDEAEALRRVLVRIDARINAFDRAKLDGTAVPETGPIPQTPTPIDLQNPDFLDPEKPYVPAK